MKNPSGNKLEKLVFGMFDQMVEGADKYVTKQDSTWLIFTEDKRWVIEFTKDKTLWFNYNIFQSELELIGKDGTEERDLIKKWFESRFLNKPKVEETLSTAGKPLMVEDTIENGVKDTIDEKSTLRYVVEDTIENGVKETTPSGYLGSIEMKGKIVHQIESPKQNNEVEDTIQNGVKECNWRRVDNFPDFENRVIKNSVKETKENRLFRTIHVMNTIKNGVKHVEDGDWLDQDERVDDIIENGVKETKEISNISLMSEIFKVNSNRAIKDGVKELKELPDKSGELRGYGDWYHRQGNMTKPHTEYVKEIIEDSYNHMGRVEGVIRNTDKDGI